MSRKKRTTSDERRATPHGMLIQEDGEEWLTHFLPRNLSTCRSLRDIQLRVSLADLHEDLIWESCVKVVLYVSRQNSSDFERWDLCHIGECGNGEQPVGTPPRAFLREFSLEDQELLAFLKKVSITESSGPLCLSAENFCAMLSKMQARSRLWSVDGQTRVCLDNKLPRICCRVEPYPCQDAFCVYAEIQGDQGPLCFIQGKQQWLVIVNRMDIICLPETLSSEITSLLEEKRILSKEQLPYFFYYVVPRIEPYFHMDVDPRVSIPQVRIQTPDGIRIYLDYHNGSIEVFGALMFGDNELRRKHIRLEHLVHSKNGKGHILDTRPLLSIESDIESLAGSRWVDKGCYVISGDEPMFHFAYNVVPALQKRYSCVCVESAAFKTLFRSSEDVIPHVRLTLSQDHNWFEWDVSFSNASRDVHVPMDLIVDALVTQKPYLRKPDGQFLPMCLHKQERFLSIFKGIQNGKGQQSHCSNLKYLMEELSRYHDAVSVDMEQGVKDFWNRVVQTDGQAPVVSVPPELETILRSYQVEGLRWLSSLRDLGFAGILADEMGLGKTLQVLSLLRTGDKSGGPSLVVCPTSVMWNWVDEAQKFIPSLRTLIVHGQERHKLLSTCQDYDLVITSYSLLRRDHTHYQPIAFYYIVLDEAQMIKNPDAQIARCVKQLRSRHRLALSGTPLENNLTELWSLFEFLMRGLLPARSSFRRRFEIPICKDRDENTLQQLQRKLNPFILRRLKKDVIAELPEKIERIHRGELTDLQREMYQKTLDVSREKIHQAFLRRGLEKSRFTVLTALLRLRQICCHPQLIDRHMSHGNENEALSGKFNMAADLIRKIMANNQKVLVFSQFTRMLDIFEHWLRCQRISFARLDGKTLKRHIVVQGFERSASQKVFLISLKAGGTGLNLVSASHVILYDPWWNPAIEHQAIDRSHRIGQKQVVNAYRLIMRGTIEEKILSLQSSKQHLMNAVVKANQDAMAHLSLENVRYLFDM